MKIKTKNLTYSEVLELTPMPYQKPLKPMVLLALVIRVLYKCPTA